MTAGALAADPAVRARTWRERITGDNLLRGSAFIMATSAVTSLIGYGFWLLVDHRFAPAASGAAAAATSVVQATVQLASAGAGAAMIEWLPRSRSALERRQRLTIGLAVAAASSAVGGVIAALLLGRVLGTLPSLGTPGGAAAFCLAGVFLALGIVLDAVAVSERRGGLMLARNAVCVAARIPLLLLPWPLLGGADRILTAWTAAAGVSLLVSVAAFPARGVSLRPALGAVRTHLREMAGSLVGQHLTTIAAILGAYLMPLLVVARISAEANAYFYATWMLGSVFFMISPAVSAALFAEAANDPRDVAVLARRCVVTIAALLTPPTIVYLCAGGLLLELFGPEYPAHGRLLLILLTLSAVPDAITNVAAAVLRATGRVRQALRLNAAMLLGYLALAWWLLPTLGILAAGVGWLLAQTVGAVWALARRRRILAPTPLPGHPG